MFEQILMLLRNWITQQNCIQRQVQVQPELKCQHCGDYETFSRPMYCRVWSSFNSINIQFCLQTAILFSFLCTCSRELQVVPFLNTIVFGFNCMFVYISMVLLYFFLVGLCCSYMSQRRYREISVKTLNSGSIACWVAELNAALCLDTRIKKCKY